MLKRAANWLGSPTPPAAVRNCCIVSGEKELKSRFENALGAEGDAGGSDAKRFGDVIELYPEFVRVRAVVGGGGSREDEAWFAAEGSQISLVHKSAPKCRPTAREVWEPVVVTLNHRDFFDLLFLVFVFGVFFAPIEFS